MVEQRLEGDEGVTGIAGMQGKTVQSEVNSESKSSIVRAGLTCWKIASKCMAGVEQVGERQCWRDRKGPFGSL